MLMAFFVSSFIRLFSGNLNYRLAICRFFIPRISTTVHSVQYTIVCYLYKSRELKCYSYYIKDVPGTL